MANILYGVAGQGFGHSSRSKEVINYLISRGHKVKILTHDAGIKNLSPYFDVEEIFGLRFTYQNNQVKYLPTLFNNLLKSKEVLTSLNMANKIAKSFKAQIVFTDFEPISAMIAHRRRLPLISIDNQHMITNTEIEYPRLYEKDAVLAKTVVRLAIFKAQAYLVTTFFKAKLINKKTILVPPIIRSDALSIDQKEKDFTLVYLTSEFKGLIRTLAKINQNFVVYGFNKEKIEHNIEFKKHSTKGFLKDIASSKGIIANSGFTLISEALFLKKPYLAVPVSRQFEQILNAYYLEKLGFGKYWDKINKEKIESFLFNLNKFKKNLKGYKKENNTTLLNIIDKQISKYVK